MVWWVIPPPPLSLGGVVVVHRNWVHAVCMGTLCPWYTGASPGGRGTLEKGKTVNTYTREDVTAVSWAHTIINSRGAYELTFSRIDKLNGLAARASVGDTITQGDSELLEWVAYELRQHPVGHQYPARLFDGLTSKLGIDYPVANTKVTV